MFKGLSRRQRSFEPGESIELARSAKIRVWDIFLDVTGDSIVATSIDGKVATTLSELPLSLGRFCVQRVGERAVSVVVIERPDSAYIGTLDEVDSRAPQVSPEFTGIALAGPRRVSFHGTISTEEWHQEKVPEFVVTGFFAFTPSQVRELRDRPSNVARLVVTNRATHQTVDQTVKFLNESYVYQVIGISRSPASEPEWIPPGDGDFARAGEYFDVQLGLYVHDPDGEPYELHVQAFCGDHASNTVAICIED